MGEKLAVVRSVEDSYMILDPEQLARASMVMPDAAVKIERSRQLVKGSETLVAKSLERIAATHAGLDTLRSSWTLTVAAGPLE